MTENERIREIRKSRSLTMEEFGQRVGVGKTAISKIEKAERGVTDQMRLSICREFGINEEWLRTGAGEMKRPEPASLLDDFRTRYDLTDDDLAFYRAFAELDAAQRRAVLDFADRIVEARKQKKPPQSIADAAAEADPESSLERIAEQIRDQKKHGEKSSVSNG